MVFIFILLLPTTGLPHVRHLPDCRQNVVSEFFAFNDGAMAKKRKTPPPDPATAWHHAARKIGESVRFSFLRCIKREMKCSDQEAEHTFKTAVERGDIIFTGMAGLLGDVPKYRMK